MKDDFEIIRALEPIVNVFDELHIEYYIGGSIASSIYGIPRTTLDIDMVSSLNQFQVDLLVDRLKVEYLVDREMIIDAIKTRSSFNIFHVKSYLKIDVFVLRDRNYPKVAFERRKKSLVEHGNSSINIFLSSPEDVILTKLEWYNLGNRISERQWNDVLGVIKVQGNSLDEIYLRKWAGELGVLNLLEKALSEGMI